MPSGERIFKGNTMNTEKQTSKQDQEIMDALNLLISAGRISVFVREQSTILTLHLVDSVCMNGPIFQLNTMTETEEEAFIARATKKGTQ